MLLRTHLTINLFFALLFSAYFQNAVPFVLLVLLATSLADIDNARSLISRNFRLLGRLARFFAKHRGFFHSLTFAAAFSLFVSGISGWVGMAVFLGYALHLFEDSFTQRGIQVFWPFPFMLRGRIRTSGIVEKFFFWIFMLLNISWFVARLI